jgi:hypothetical protein
MELTFTASQSFSSFGKTYSGSKLSINYFEHIIDGQKEADIYGIDTDGSRKLLCRVRRNVFSEEQQRSALETFLPFAKKARSYRRSIGEERDSVHSMIAGSWDRFDAPTGLRWKKYYPDLRPPRKLCRLTRFTRDYPELWRSKAIPWIQAISEEHRKLAPEPHAHQMSLADQALPMFRIEGTPYSTITVNFNVQTAVHVDRGNKNETLGNLTVLGHGFTGALLCFPRF